MTGERSGRGGRPPAGLVLLPALLAPAAVLLARAAQERLLLIVLATLAVYPVMATFLLRGRRRAALVAVLLWAASLSIAVISTTSRNPDSMRDVVLNGPAYRDQMFGFIRTGVGKESDPAQFVPEHLAHLAIFSLLAAGSGGLLALALGSVLVGYMSFYVGSLAAQGLAPSTAYLLGWPPWAILRVLAFVLIGIALSEPLLGVIRKRFTGDSAKHPLYRSWYLAAGILLLCDLLLKFLLAPSWAVILRPCLGS